MSERWDIAGKRVILTGATNGIGLAAAKALVADGARLAIVARNAERADAALSAIAPSAGNAPVDVLLADLSSQAEIRRLAADIGDRYPRLDVLVNNAGATYTRRRQSVDGVELTWAVNHLAPFLLTTLLLERLKSSAPARVITTSSDAHLGNRIPFDDFDARRRYRRFPPATARPSSPTSCSRPSLPAASPAPASPPTASIRGWWRPASTATTAR